MLPRPAPDRFDDMPDLSAVERRAKLPVFGEPDRVQLEQPQLVVAAFFRSADEPIGAVPQVVEDGAVAAEAVGFRRLFSG